MQCTILLFCFCFITILSQYQISRLDPLAELSASLHTRRGGACDGERLDMECPPATKISIQLVQYGRLTPEDGLCPANIRYPGPRTSITASDDREDQEKCLILEAIRAVESRCHSKESCSLTASPASLARGLRDPCPTVRKYVEVLYKCKPASFRSRVVCGSQSVSLSCPAPHTRLAIFSAVFSRAAGGHVFCPGAGRADTARRCDHSVTESVSSLCHGYSTCSFRASPAGLGLQSVCRGVDPHQLTLKLTFACVDKSVFHTQYVDRVTTASTTTTTTTIATTSTTTTPPSPQPKLVPSTLTVKPVISSDVKLNDILKSQESKKLVVNLQDSKGSPGKENAPSMLETNSNFEQEHKYKLLMFSGLVAFICLVSSLLFISIKVYQSMWSGSRRPPPGLELETYTDTYTDTYTVSSELELTADFSAAASCQTLASASRSELKPKGILKKSRTSENFRLYNNPVDDSAVKSGTLGEHFPLSHDSPRKTLMNSQFLHHDIEDQLKNLPDRVAMAENHSFSVLNPYFDGVSLASERQESHEVTANITTELIQTLIKLRSALPSAELHSSPHSNNPSAEDVEEEEKLFVL